MSINRELREQLLSRTKKCKFRVHMLNESQQRLREGVENKLHVKHYCKSIAKETQKLCPKVNCNRKCTSDFLNEVFPFVRIMKRYNMRKNFLQDIVAGLTVGVMHIPQGMAYGFLSQLPPIYGLYTSFFPVLLYFFFGSSRHISIGTFAVVSLMVGQVVNRGYQMHLGEHAEVVNTTIVSGTSLNGTTLNPVIKPIVTQSPASTEGYANPIKLGYALSVTFVVGCIQILFGILRLGGMATFMSDPFISGFTTGAACHVFSSQIKHIFGIRVKYYHGPLALIYFYAEFFVNVTQTNMVTFTASLTCLLVLVLIKEGINNNGDCKPHLLMPIPIELIVISVGTIVSYYTKLESEFDVHVVGVIPQGLPEPTVSHFRYVPEVLGDGLVIGFIAYAISYSMAKILADRHGYRVNANQEMVALGVCNFTCSFFSSYCCAASLSRSLVQDGAGGKTQELIALGLCNFIGSMFKATCCAGTILDSLLQDSVGGKTQLVGIISSMVVLVVLLYIGPLFHSLPECILAAIVIVTLKGMFLQFKELNRLWRLSKKDFAVWLVTFIAVVVLDVALGLLIGIVFSLYFVLRHSQKPHMSQLGQVPGTGAYKDVKTSTKVTQIDGMKIFRFEASIYFANAEHFRDRLYEKTGLVPRKLKKKKRRAMHDTLLRRKRELAEVELQRSREKEKSGKSKAIEIIVTPHPVDPYEEEQKKSRENKLILERFKEAWQPPIKILIIDMSLISYIDTVAIKTLTSIVNDYKELGIKVFLAGCKTEIRNMLRQAEFYKAVNYNCIYFTVHEAVIIGEEILEKEAKSQSYNPVDVKLFKEVSAVQERPEGEQDEDADDEDEDDVSDEEKAKDAAVSSESEYDTSQEDNGDVVDLHKQSGHSKSKSRRVTIRDEMFEMVPLSET